MENLPIPLSRVELYLAKACGMDVTVPEAPQSRLEQYLAIIAGDTTIEMPTPHSLTEQWLAYILGVEPSPMLEVVGAHYIDNQKVDTRYLAVAAGMPGAVAPARPQNRKEQYWAVLAEILPVHGVLKYATGTNIYLTDVVSGIEELQFVYGDTFQQTYSGKNLFNKTATPYSFASSTVSQITNGIRVASTRNGTGLSLYVLYLLDNTNDYIGKTLTLSANMQASASNIPRILLGLCDSSGGNASGKASLYNNGSVSYQVENDPTRQYLFLAIYSTSGSTVQVGDYVDYTNIQLEVGSTPTSYEPYVGGIPSPNPDYPQDIDVVTGEQTVKVTGKNMFDKTSGTLVSINVSGNTRWGYKLPKVTNDFYFTKSIDDQIGFRLVEDVNGSIVSLGDVYTMNSATKFTNTSNDMYVLCFATQNKQNAQGYFDNNNFMMSYTNVAYEPYQGQSYTVDLGSIELCKIGTYQDYIYKSGADWYVHKAITKTILDGAEDWSNHNTYNDIKGFYWLNAGAAHSNSAIIANSYRGVPITTYNSNNRTFGMIATFESGTTLTTYTIFATQPNASTSSLAQFKTWLNSNNITTYYAAETSTDTKITDNTLIGQLNAVDSAVLPKPVAYLDISASGTNLPASIKISYYGEEE